MGLLSFIIGKTIDSFDKQKEDEFLNEFRPYGRFVTDPSNGFKGETFKTLYISKRGKGLKKLLFSKAINYSYGVKEPDKLVFTSATVGGITTGGTHIQEGRTNYSTSVSGKYAIAYGSNNSVHGSYATEIFISKDIFTAAEKAGIPGLFKDKCDTWHDKYTNHGEQYKYGIYTVCRSQMACDKLIDWLAN